MLKASQKIDQSMRCKYMANKIKKKKKIREKKKRYSHFLN